MKRGYFVTFEGCEGCGKSTQARLFGEHAQRSGVVKTIREPGGTPLGEEIRTLLKRPGTGMTSTTELLLMNASRAQLVGEVIVPSLERGEIVVCDRFYDSTVAYQGYGRGIDLNILQEIVGFAAPIVPDITYLFNRNPREGLATAHSERGKGVDRFEDEDIAFHERVYQGYLKIAAAEPERVRVIPYRSGDIKVMHAEVVREFEAMVQRNP